MRSDDPPSNVTVAYRRQYRRCGKPDCPACRPGLPGHGPYWYARWQEGGRTRSRYLGRQTPPDIAGPAPAAPLDTSTDPGLAPERERLGDAAVLPRRLAPPARRDAAPAMEDAEGAEGSPARRGLRVRTLGAFTVWRGGELIPAARWSRPTVAALFKCLLAAPGHRMSREQVIDALWPEGDPDRAATNLRATVHRLRAVLDEPGTVASYLRSEGSLLVLDPCPTAEHGRSAPPAGYTDSASAPPMAWHAWLDADAFAHAARDALAGSDVLAGQTALAFYEGDYLPDDLYEDWAAARREDLRQQYHALLLRVARLYANGGEAAPAMRCLRLLLTADSCHEPAARLLMRLLAADGGRAEALRLYDVLARPARRPRRGPYAGDRGRARGAPGHGVAGKRRPEPGARPHQPAGCSR